MCVKKFGVLDNLSIISFIFFVYSLFLKYLLVLVFQQSFDAVHRGTA